MIPRVYSTAIRRLDLLHKVCIHLTVHCILLIITRAGCSDHGKGPVQRKASVNYGFHRQYSLCEIANPPRPSTITGISRYWAWLLLLSHRLGMYPALRILLTFSQGFSPEKFRSKHPNLINMLMNTQTMTMPRVVEGSLKPSRVYAVSMPLPYLRDSSRQT